MSTVTLAGNDLERLQTVATALRLAGTVEGTHLVQESLEREPFPHYFAHGDSSELLLRVEADGSRCIGKFVGREFVPVDQ